MSIGEMNQEAVFRVWAPGLSANNTPIKTLASAYVDWVDIEHTSGSKTLEQQQISFDKAYRITKRHYPDRPVNVAMTTIRYGNNELSIGNLELQNEGRRTYEILTCYTVSGGNELEESV